LSQAQEFNKMEHGLKGGSCNAVLADRGVRASHFDCPLCTAKSYPRWCKFLLWKFEGLLALVLVSTFALARVLVSLLISIPAIVKRRSAIANQTQENSGAGESVTARDPAVLMKAALRESCFGLFTSETSSG
jgi:hypothetical protein